MAGLARGLSYRLIARARWSESKRLEPASASDGAASACARMVGRSFIVGVPLFVSVGNNCRRIAGERNRRSNGWWLCVRSRTPGEPLPTNFVSSEIARPTDHLTFEGVAHELRNLLSTGLQRRSAGLPVHARPERRDDRTLLVLQGWLPRPGDEHRSGAVRDDSAPGFEPRLRTRLERRSERAA